MDVRAGEEMLRCAAVFLDAETMELLRVLHGFTRLRLSGAGDGQRKLAQLVESDADQAALERELHGFLSQCWDSLDGLGREVNLCMAGLFPEAGLFPPLRMTRQCTFYVVRKKLHDYPGTVGHPVSGLLWHRTRDDPAEAYERLSFLYNWSLFAPVPMPDGRLLPGSGDVPEVMRGLVRAVRSGPLGRCGISEGSDEIVRWLERLAADCYGELARAANRPAGGGATTR